MTLIGHWQFNETTGSVAADETVNGNDLTLNNYYGDPTAQWVAGQYGNALFFSGAGHDASLAHTTHFQTAAVAVSVWVKPDEISVGLDGWVISEGDNWGIVIDRWEAHDLLFYFYNGTHWNTYALAENTLIHDGSWHHIVGQYDPAYGAVELFLDGALIATQESTDAISYSYNYGLFVGAMNGNRNYGGLIDELKIFDARQTPSEVALLAGVTDWTLWGANRSSVKAGEEVRLSLINASASGKTVTLGSNTVALTSQSETEIIFNAPILHTLSSALYDYSQALTFTVTDGADSDTFVLTVEPEEGAAHGTFAGEVRPGSLFEGDPVAPGVNTWMKQVTGSGALLNAVTGGAVYAETGDQFEVAYYDGEWGSVGTKTMANTITGNAQSSGYPTNIRSMVAFGQSIDGQFWSRADEGAKTWFEDAWDTHIADRWDNQPEAWDEHFVGIFFPFEWKQLYVDHSIVPTSVQARDHTWSNYIWNNGGINDPIAKAKLHPRVIAGDAVLIPKIGFSATATPSPVPDFIKATSSWWWLGGSTSTGPGDQEFIRYDNADVRAHVENTLYALHQKYGNDPAVMMFIFGEYFNGPSADHPAGFNATTHKEGVKTILINAIADMPLDSNGKRQMIGLSSPTFGGGFVRDDIINMGICPVASNVELIFPPEGYDLLANDLYYVAQGIPVLSKTDSRFFDLGKTFDWTSAPSNPFGLGSGDTAVQITAEQVLWYRTNIVPTHSILFNTGSGLTQSAINTAISKYARGGSEVATWGAGPIAYSVASSPGGSSISLTPIQTKEGTGSSVTSASLTLDATQTAGSYVLYLLSLNGPRNGITWPAGFTEIHSTTSDDSGSVMTQAWAWSNSVSGAQVVSWSSTTGYTATLVEMPGDGLIVSAIGNKNEDVTQIAEGGANSVGTGAAVNVNANSIALAFFGFDNHTKVDGGKTYSDSFSEILFRNTGVDSSHALAGRVLSSVATYSCTFNTIDTGDNLYGSILILEGDGTKPVLSGSTATATSATTADGTVSTDTSGATLSEVITESSTKPTTTQVAAGQDHTGTAVGVGKFQSKTVIASGPQMQSFTGLSANTNYYKHSSHDGSDVVTASFTTEQIPVITLLGDNPLAWEAGVPFVDPGATATDNEDGSLTVVVTGTVDVNSIGANTLNYNVTDSSGDAAVQVQRTVNVADTIAPVITLNGGDLALMQGDAFTDPGAVAIDVFEGSVTVNVSGDAVDTGTLATYTILYDAADSTGNNATQLSRDVVVGAIPSGANYYTFGPNSFRVSDIEGRIEYTLSMAAQTWFVVYSDTLSKPSITQVKAGQDATGSAAQASGGYTAKRVSESYVLATGAGLKIAIYLDDGFEVMEMPLNFVQHAWWEKNINQAGLA